MNRIQDIARAESKLREEKEGLTQASQNLAIESLQNKEGEDEEKSGLAMGGGIGLAPVFKFAGDKIRGKAIDRVKKGGKSVIDDWNNKTNPTDISESDIGNMSKGDLRDGISSLKSRISDLPLDKQVKVNSDLTNVKAPTDDLDGYRTSFMNKQKVVSKAEMSNPATRDTIRASEISDLNAESRLTAPATGSATGGTVFNNPNSAPSGTTTAPDRIEAGDAYETLTRSMEKPAQSALDTMAKNGVDIPEGFKGIDLAEGIAKKGLGISAEDGIKEMAEKIGEKFGVSSALDTGLGIAGKVVSGALDFISPIADVYGIVSGIESLASSAKTEAKIEKASASIKSATSGLQTAPTFNMGSMAMPKMDTSTIRSGGMMNF